MQFFFSLCWCETISLLVKGCHGNMTLEHIYNIFHEHVHKWMWDQNIQIFPHSLHLSAPETGELVLNSVQHCTAARNMGLCLLRFRLHAHSLHCRSAVSAWSQSPDCPYLSWAATLHSALFLDREAACWLRVQLPCTGLLVFTCPAAWSWWWGWWWGCRAVSACYCALKTWQLSNCGVFRVTGFHRILNISATLSFINTLNISA